MLANFSKMFVQIANNLTGKDINWNYQATWEFEQFTPTEQDRVWDVIHTTRDFWLGLEPIEPTALLRDVEERHTPIFITNRDIVSGQSIERQTQKWLNWNKFVAFPTVIVTPSASKKVTLYNDLGLDAYIDDRPSTIRQMQNAHQNIYVFDQPYNRDLGAGILAEPPRVKSVGEYVKIVEDRLGKL